MQNVLVYEVPSSKIKDSRVLSLIRVRAGFYTGTPVFAFGAGLSFTSFERSLSWAAPAAAATAGADGGHPVVSISEDTNGDADRVVARVAVSVKNSGDRAGDEVVMVFVSAPAAAIALGAPKQQLASFERISLEAGASATVMLDVTQRHIIGASTAAGGGVSDGWRVRVNDDVGSALEFGVRVQ